MLRQADVNVFVPSRQRSSGMAALIVGDIDHARDAAPGESARAGQRRSRRLHGRLFRADGRTDAAPGIRQADRRPRCRAGRRQHDGRRPVPARASMRGASYRARTSRSHARVGYHQPCHLASARRRHARARAAAERSRARRRVHQPRLLGHGRHLRARSRSLLDLAPRRPRTAEAAPRRRHRDRRRPNAAPAGSRWSRG